jgi:UDP-N-acetyl-2-amino-2-deoxyglucuronate dehydrogenase
MKSWKGDENKSGGVVTNIGVHFFDMLHFVFGEIMALEVHYKDDKTVSGFIKYKRANVKWFLSIDEKYLPKSAIDAKQRTYRSITVDDQELEFSGGFTDLHTLSYQKILSGRGFGSAENKVAIETVEKIRQSNIEKPSDNFHPMFEELK